MEKENLLKVALSQISPVWLDKMATLKKIEKYILEAAKNEAELVVFGEGLLPGYPFWLALTDGAEWNSKVNKELHAHYVRNSVTIEKGDLDSVCALAKKHKIFVVEDAAQAIDSYYKGKALGSIGHLATFSFHETKNIISGEGGL